MRAFLYVFVVGDLLGPLLLVVLGVAWLVAWLVRWIWEFLSDTPTKQTQRMIAAQEAAEASRLRYLEYYGPVAYHTRRHVAQPPTNINWDDIADAHQTMQTDAWLRTQPGSETWPAICSRACARRGTVAQIRTHIEGVRTGTDRDDRPIHHYFGNTWPPDPRALPEPEGL